MNPKKEAQIKRLQDNLLAIRKFAGWTTKQLGDEIGVTKQTISNLERKSTKMTLTQYYAIRAVLNDEIEHHPENEILCTAVPLLLDEEALSDEQRDDLSKQMNLYASAIAGGAKREDMEDMIKAALKILAPIAGGIVAGIATKSPFMATQTWVTMMRSLNEGGSEKNEKK